MNPPKKLKYSLALGLVQFIRACCVILEVTTFSKVRRVTHNVKAATCYKKVMAHVGVCVFVKQCVVASASHLPRRAFYLQSSDTFSKPFWILEHAKKDGDVQLSFV